MTKEEIFEISDLNKEENKKYICHEAQEVAIYLQTDKFAPIYCLLERAYICGRKTSEKQIDELVSKNDKLEKENAELKEQLETTKSNADSYYDKLAELQEQTMKNTNIGVSCSNCYWNQYDEDEMCYNCCGLDKWELNKTLLKGD